MLNIPNNMHSYHATYNKLGLGDVGVSIMTVLNIIVIMPMPRQSLDFLRSYEDGMRTRYNEQEE